MTPVSASTAMVLEAAALEDARVGVVHLLVADLRRLVGDVKAVGVLHDEFLGPHQTEAGPDFVAELGLDLVEILGQLAVGTQFGRDQGGDDLLMGRPQNPFLFGVVAGLEEDALGAFGSGRFAARFPAVAGRA